jgi:DNA-binding XRE family transcriptional regulator
MTSVPLEKAFELLSEEDRAYVKRKGKELLDDYKALSDVRAEIGMTQNDLADALEINQKNVSSLENRDDMKISTLRNYLHAMGGELVIAARFSDQETRVIQSLSD